MMDTAIQKQIDTSSREKIIGNTDANYFVEAGAGSGKTTVLVERMVSMIKEGKDISHISAITFTKAAANEFYARFQKRLVEESANNQCCANALQNIDLAFMGTIDSFCNMILSEHPSIAEIPSSASIMDEDTAEKIYKREYSAIMNGLYQNKGLEAKAKNFLHYTSHPEDDFITILNILLAHRDCEMVIPEYSDRSIDDDYADEIGTVRGIVRYFCRNPQFITAKNEETAETVRKNFETYRNILEHSWNNNIPNLLLAYKKTFGDKDFRLLPDTEEIKKLGAGSDYFSEHLTRNKLAWYEVNEERLPKIIEDIKNRQYAVMLDFVSCAKNEILKRLRKEGSLTFNDYLVYLRDTLKKDAGKDGKLIRHIQERHRYFMIDEFQDTDPIQAEIFFYLSAKEISENWKECVPYPGSLFIVGDPKQSIYRFKNADVASYLRIKEMFQGEKGEVLELFCNFRSRNTIKKWFNETFEKLLKDSDEQAAYKSIPIEKENGEGDFTGIYVYDTSFNDVPKEDAYRIADIILKLVDNENYLYYDRKKDTYRRYDWKDFMVITPTKPSIAKYTRAFMEYGIPSFVEGNIVFSEAPSLKTLYKVFGAVTQKNDNRYLYAALKSEMYGIDEEEIAGYKSAGNALNLMSPINGGATEKLADALSELKSLSDKAEGMNSSSLIRVIFETTKLFEKSGTLNLEYPLFVLEMIKKKESSGEIVTFKDTLDFLEELIYEKNSQERCPGLDMNGNRVHIANLHKVKGLEAPIVLLAYPREKARSISFRTVRSEEGNRGYLFEAGVVSPNGSTVSIISTKLYDELKEKEKDSLDAEKLRLAYVAATRAGSVLIIGRCLDSKGNLGKSNPWNSLLDINVKLDNIDNILYQEERSLREKKAAEKEDTDRFISVLKKNEDSLNEVTKTTLRPSAQVNFSHQEESEDADISLRSQKIADESRGDTLATISGTMVHRLMELIILSKDSFQKEDVVFQVIEECLREEFASYRDDLRAMLENVFDTMHQGGFVQKGKAPQDILKILLDADEIFPEVPFAYKKDGVIWNGIIDLIYRKDDKLHIIDWKTNADDSGLDEHYEGQLRSYVSAVEESSNLHVEDAIIYHISIK